jgi:DNA-binding MarR family transcriptional regulator
MPPGAATPSKQLSALAADLNTLICFIHKQSSQEFFAVAEELDMSIVQCKALHRLEQHADEASVKELAELLGVSLPATSRTVESLLCRGLLARREDEHDRRVKRVCLTPAGHDAVMRLNGARQADLERFVETLSPRERRRVAEALKPLLERDEIAACRIAETP